MVKPNILNKLTYFYRIGPIPSAKVQGRKEVTVQTVARTHINSTAYDDANEDIGVRSREISVHSDISGPDYDGDFERNVRHEASSFSRDKSFHCERLQRSSSLSSITIPLEISCFSISPPVIKFGDESDGRLIKVMSRRNPHILRAKTIYVPRYGRGYVLKIRKSFGRATKFIIVFEKHGVMTLALSRRPGQEGESFYVSDSAI